MMDDEQDIVTAMLLTKRSETRRRRVALQSELRTAGKSLYSIGGALKNLTPNSIRNRIDYILPIIARTSSICDLGGVRAMLEELKELEMQLAELNRGASSMGID